MLIKLCNKNIEALKISSDITFSAKKFKKVVFFYFPTMQWFPYWSSRFCELGSADNCSNYSNNLWVSYCLFQCFSKEIV